MTTEDGATGCEVIAFAHRGARSQAPENTIEAFLLALELGATGLESDVWLTADGVAVLDHDGQVGPRRTPIGSLEHRDLPGAIPTLGDLYAACGTDFELSLDLKDHRAIVEVVAVAETHGAVERLWVVHELVDVLAEWRRRWPGLRLVHTTSVGAMVEGPSEHASRLGEVGVEAVNLRSDEWSPELVALFHSRGRLCFAWDAQDSETMHTLLQMGVDALYSDHVGELVRAVAAGP